MISQRTVLLLLGAFGLCGCNLVLDLARFDSATLAAGDGPGNGDDEASTGDSGEDSASPGADAEAGMADATFADAGDGMDGTPDGAGTDGADSATPDALQADTSTTDVSTADVSTTDASTTDVSTTDVSTTDVSTTDASTTDDSDVGNPPALIFTWDYPAQGAMGWKANGWNADNSAIQSCCATQQITTDGIPTDPIVGCMTTTLLFSASGQTTGPNLDIPGTEDITGMTLSFYMKFDPSTAGSEGLDYSVNWLDSTYQYTQAAWGPVPESALAGQWTRVSIPISTFSNVGVNPGQSDPGIAQHFGFHFTSSGTGPFATTTLYLDNYVIQ